MTIVSPFTDVTLLMYVPTYMKPPGVDIACPLHGVTGNRHICSVDAHSFEAFDSCKQLVTIKRKRSALYVLTTERTCMPCSVDMDRASYTGGQGGGYSNDN